jgi:mono/diheme cytochrome c family protein
VLAGAGALIAIAALGGLWLRSRTRVPGPDIPDAMKPGPSDAALETPLLQKLQGWSVLMLAFFVVWIPATWIFEPKTNLNQEKELEELALQRGRVAVLPFSEQNQLGVGCVRCHGPDLTGGVIQTGDTYAFPPNLTTLCGGPNTGHAAIYTIDDIYQVISEGRGAMPSWSIRFEGALDDQQINDIVVYLVNLSSKPENVPFEQNVCLNEDASKKALEDASTNPRDP